MVNIQFNGEANGDTRKNVLDNIQAMVPNHEARLSSVQVGPMQLTYLAMRLIVLVNQSF